MCPNPVTVGYIFYLTYSFIKKNTCGTNYKLPAVILLPSTKLLCVTDCRQNPVKIRCCLLKRNLVSHKNDRRTSVGRREALMKTTEVQIGILLIVTTPTRTSTKLAYTQYSNTNLEHRNHQLTLQYRRGEVKQRLNRRVWLSPNPQRFLLSS